MGPVLSEWKILCSTAFLQETSAKTPVVLLFRFQCNRNEKKSLRSNSFSFKLDALNLISVKQFRRKMSSKGSHSNEKFSGC